MSNPQREAPLQPSFELFYFDRFTYLCLLLTFLIFPHDVFRHHAAYRREEKSTNEKVSYGWRGKGRKI